MKRLTAGTKVDAGYYWHMGAWEITRIESAGVLPGAAGDTYLKLPLLALFAVTPVMGVAFVMFLPFIGFALFFGLLARKAAASIQNGFFELAALVHPAWRPGEAYLTGKREAAEAPETNGDRALDALADEIAARRGKE